MTSLARIRPSLRRAAFVAALGALMVPATAGAAVHAEAAAKKKKKSHLPVVTRVTPMHLAIGETLEIRGHYFLRGRNKNTVVFKRTGGRAVFVKALIGTTKLLRVTVPAKLAPELKKGAFGAVATRFRIRILTKKLGKRFTTASRSPLISAAPAAPAPAPAPPALSAPLTPTAPDGASTQPLPEGDCDGDGQLNRDDADDDNDLLPDSVEAGINSVLVAKYGPGIAQMDPCNADSDGDGVDDGYEYQSAKDLNDDENQEPNKYLPYPGKRPYANPLFKDADTDYDGDTLTLGEEYALWKYVGNRTLTPLSYSDGEQYSASRRLPNGHREPTLLAAGYPKQADFVSWANASGYRNITLWGAKNGAGHWYDPANQDVYGLFDVDRSAPDNDPGDNAFGESPSELNYYDIDGDGYLSDNERDEDADGLTNYDEAHGRMLASYWSSCYAKETPYHIAYAGTDLTDPDSDGDGVRDGADDQDHDDIPNVDELSRFAASGGLDDRKKGKVCQPKDGLGEGNFSVTGGPLPDSAVVVSFVNELGDRDVSQMTASDAGLSGGSSPTVSAATIRQGDAGQDEQQKVTITGSPTGGGFTLTLDGQTTPQLAYNSNAAAVQVALKALVPGDASNHPAAFGRVNPFNPCLPFRASRTCPTAVDASTGAPFDDSLSWVSLQ
jgi:hypothetical protein